MDTSAASTWVCIKTVFWYGLFVFCFYAVGTVISERNRKRKEAGKDAALRSSVRVITIKIFDILRESTLQACNMDFSEQLWRIVYENSGNRYNTFVLDFRGVTQIDPGAISNEFGRMRDTCGLDVVVRVSVVNVPLGVGARTEYEIKSALAERPIIINGVHYKVEKGTGNISIVP